MNQERSDHDYAAYRRLLALWAAENPIKTSKLQFLMLTNAVLITGFTLNGGLLRDNWPICLGGTLLSCVWLVSIARTTLFQKVWQIKLRELAEGHPGDARFGVHDTGAAVRRARHSNPLLRACGGVPSKYYLIAAPLVLALAWAAALLFALLGAA